MSRSPVVGWILMVASVLGAAAAGAQTVEQSEESIAYLMKRVCMFWTGAAWMPDPGPPTVCLSNEDCVAPSYCKHLSIAQPASDLYPRLEFPDAPGAAGSGEGYLRYVPLCEDGSGDHEYSLSAGSSGTPPTCASADFIRCADGGRPRYRADSGTANDWLIHAGAGGHVSAPNATSQPVWVLAHTQDRGAYTVSPTPRLRKNLEGIFDEDAANPFASFNRIWIEKCTPDRWLGNRAHHDLRDFLEPVTLEVVTGACSDSDGNGTANCQDAACVCSLKTVDPPSSLDHEYSVYYHGKRIVRAVLADLLGGISVYNTFPDGIAETFSLPDADSKIVFHCHSNGCNGLQGGHIDDLHAAIDAALETDVDVRALFSSSLNANPESEITVSDYDCVDTSPADGVPDNDGEIDDSLSLYDHLIDDRSITLQAMSTRTHQPGPLGEQHRHLADWWDPTDPQYAEPVDASCLATHCPGSTDGWLLDSACAPCNDSRHVLLNHLQTPFLYNQAQRDNTIGKGMNHCESAGEPPAIVSCDVVGGPTGINMRDTHWRKLVRKTIADLYRSAELERCEGGPGSEWPYNHILLLAPDWQDHGALSKPEVSAKQLDLPGAGGFQSIARWAHDFVLSSPSMPAKEICLVEKTAGENALDFDDPGKGGVAPCAQ